MGIAIGTEHRQLASVARGVLADNEARAQHRAMLDAEDDPSLPLEGVAELGWLGLHLPEAHGGSGYGYPELAVVLDEMGRAAAPAVPADRPRLRRDRRLRHQSAAGESCLAWPTAPGSPVSASPAPSPQRVPTVDGDAGVVLAADVADVLLLALGDDMVVLDRAAIGVTVTPAPSLDKGRRVARVPLTAVPLDLPSCRARPAGPYRSAGPWPRQKPPAGRQAAPTADEYAKLRIAFGRPIGQFQAVKHHCANMFAQSEIALAAAWDAARFAADPERPSCPPPRPSVALPAFLYCARLNIQVHGGHRLHLGARRPPLLPSGHVADRPVRPASRRPREACSLPPSPATGPMARFDVSPPAGDPGRRPGLPGPLRGLPEAERRDALVDSGFLVPHWPPPWGKRRPARPDRHRRGACRHPRGQLRAAGWR